jgi:hypothetical protein
MSRAISYTRFDEALLKELEKLAESFRDADLDDTTYKAFKKRLGRSSKKSAADDQVPLNRPAGSAILK